MICLAFLLEGGEGCVYVYLGKENAEFMVSLFHVVGSF